MTDASAKQPGERVTYAPVTDDLLHHYATLSHDMEWRRMARELIDRRAASAPMTDASGKVSDAALECIVYEGEGIDGFAYKAARELIVLRQQSSQLDHLREQLEGARVDADFARKMLADESRDSRDIAASLEKAVELVDLADYLIDQLCMDDGPDYPLDDKLAEWSAKHAAFDPAQRTIDATIKGGP